MPRRPKSAQSGDGSRKRTADMLRKLRRLARESRQLQSRVETARTDNAEQDERLSAQRRRKSRR